MRLRSPDVAKRNPGTVHHATKVPGYASLHPGYGLYALKAKLLKG
jgi:hypothetical protein